MVELQTSNSTSIHATTLQFTPLPFNWHHFPSTRLGLATKIGNAGQTTLGTISSILQQQFHNWSYGACNPTRPSIAQWSSSVFHQKSHGKPDQSRARFWDGAFMLTLWSCSVCRRCLQAGAPLSNQPVPHSPLPQFQGWGCCMEFASAALEDPPYNGCK